MSGVPPGPRKEFLFLRENPACLSYWCFFYRFFGRTRLFRLLRTGRGRGVFSGEGCCFGLVLGLLDGSGLDTGWPLSLGNALEVARAPNEMARLENRAPRFVIGADSGRFHG